MKPREFLPVAVGRLVVAVALSTVAVLPLAAQNAQDQLTTAYLLASDQSCPASPRGFDVRHWTLLPPLVPRATESVQVADARGILINGADGGTVQMKKVLHHPLSALFASSHTDTFSFTYRVTEDGLLTITVY